MSEEIMTKCIKTIIIDDNSRIRYLVREILECEKDIQVCDEAASLEEAKKNFSKWQPDVIILDILLNEYKGDLFLQELKKLSMDNKIIVLSAHSESYYSAKCLQAGAQGYVCKDKIIECLVPAIRDVYSGGQFVSSKS